MEITGGWHSKGVSNLCRKLDSDQCRQMLSSFHAKLISVVRACTRVISTLAGFGQRLVWLTIHTDYNEGWFPPELALTITLVDFHLGTTWPQLLSGWKSPGSSTPRVWVIFAENLKVIYVDRCSASLVVGTRTSFFLLGMVERFHSVVWSQSSCPQ